MLWHLSINQIWMLVWLFLVLVEGSFARSRSGEPNALLEKLVLDVGELMEADSAGRGLDANGGWHILPGGRMQQEEEEEMCFNNAGCEACREAFTGDRGWSFRAYKGAISDLGAVKGPSGWACEDCEHSLLNTCLCLRSVGDWLIRRDADGRDIEGYEEGYEELQRRLDDTAQVEFERVGLGEWLRRFAMLGKEGWLLRGDPTEDRDAMISNFKAAAENIHKIWKGFNLQMNEAMKATKSLGADDLDPLIEALLKRQDLATNDFIDQMEKMVIVMDDGLKGQHRTIHVETSIFFLTKVHSFACMVRCKDCSPSRRTRGDVSGCPAPESCDCRYRTRSS